jgi:hypothetical protein
VSFIVELFHHNWGYPPLEAELLSSLLSTGSIVLEKDSAIRKPARPEPKTAALTRQTVPHPLAHFWGSETDDLLMVCDLSRR